jgi:hypothetical protein
MSHHPTPSARRVTEPGASAAPGDAAGFSPTPAAPASSAATPTTPGGASTANAPIPTDFDDVARWEGYGGLHLTDAGEAAVGLLSYAATPTDADRLAIERVGQAGSQAVYAAARHLSLDERDDLAVCLLLGNLDVEGERDRATLEQLDASGPMYLVHVDRGGGGGGRYLRTLSRLLDEVRSVAAEHEPLVGLVLTPTAATALAESLSKASIQLERDGHPELATPLDELDDQLTAQLRALQADDLAGEEARDA